MRLKSFYAKTMTEAMQMVRDTLGEDAVIVATREERGGAVHVTAAVEPSFELGRGGTQAAEADDWLQYDDEQDESAIAEEITETMLRHGTAEDVMDNIISCATVVGMNETGPALVASVEHLFNFTPLPFGTARKAIMLAGPPGAGKTLVAAKLATRAVMNDLKVGVVSCDTVRAGGLEQLQAFTKILKVDLQKAETPNDLRYALESLKGCDQIIIDTAGTNPYDKDDVRLLAKMMGAGELDTHLVLPGGMDTNECTDMARTFSAIGVHSLIPTRLDIARRLGGLLTAAHHGNLSFADASNTPKVAEGLFALTPRSLSQLLMPSAFRKADAPQAARKTGNDRS